MIPGVLQTRLYKPRIEESHIRRDSLIAQLESAKNKTLILVSAAPGYGKSVTVSQWVEASGRPWCWLSLAEDLNDVRTFLRHVVVSVRTAFSAALGGVESMVRSEQPLPVRSYTHQLINDLDEIDEDFTLVLDDYHLIADPDIHYIIKELLRYPPGSMHLCLITRRDPPLELAKLFVQGRIEELRMSDLTFNADEAMQLSATRLNKPLSREQIAALMEQTEGWPAGILLALMAIGKGGDPALITKDIHGTLHHAAAYLATQFLDRQPRPVREALITISLFDRFCAGLIDETLPHEGASIPEPRNGGVDLIGHMKVSNLFLVSLDAHNQWFRFHHYFRKLLRDRSKELLSETVTRQIYLRASEWFIRNDLVEEALDFALLSGDAEQPGKVIKHFRHALMDGEEFWRLDRALGRLPTETVERDLALSVTRLLVVENMGNLKELFPGITAIEHRLKSEHPDGVTFGEVNFFCEEKSFFEGNYPACIRFAEQAMSSVPSMSSNTKTLAIAYKVLSVNALQGEQASVSLINEVLSRVQAKDEYLRLRLLSVRALLFSLLGKVDELIITGMEAYDLSVKAGKTETIAIGIQNVGRGYYLSGNTDRALEYLVQVPRYRFAGRRGWYFRTLALTGLTFLAKGDQDSATSTLGQMYQYIEEVAADDMVGFVKTFEVELALRTGNIEAAREAHRKAQYDMYPLWYPYYVPQLTRVKYLLLTEGGASERAAEDELEKIIQIASATSNHNVLSQALVLKADMHERRAPASSASKKALADALQHLRARGNVRTIADHGSVLATPVLKLAAQNPSDGFLARLADQWGSPIRKTSRAEASGKNVERAGGQSVQSPVDLTDRQVEILNMVSVGYSNQEIANKLFLALPSVKGHLYNIFQILGVRSRLNAVLKARDLKLLQ